MLILARESNKAVKIFDENMEWIGDVTVTEIGRTQVKLGFSFPEKFTIIREEVLTKKRKPNAIRRRSISGSGRESVEGSGDSK